MKLNERELKALSCFFYQVNNGGIEQWEDNGYAQKDLNTINGIIRKGFDESFYLEMIQDDEVDFSFEPIQIEFEGWMGNYKFYESDLSKWIEKTIKENEGFISKNNSIMLDILEDNKKGGE